MFRKHIKKVTSLLLITISFCSIAAKQDETLLKGVSVRNDTSLPLKDLLREYESLKSQGTVKAPSPEYIIPNILKIDPSPAELEFKKNNPKKQKAFKGTNGLQSPPVQISVDGFTADDNRALYGGTALPPDTNGDVGINYYIQYVNLGWLVLNKNDGSRAAGPFEGNVFWAGFGGFCETNNAGDPIVLYDKLADRWIFSQFTSSGNPDGHQCFAISTTNDPLGPYHRYEFVFPGEFNDYPHIGIWDDQTGARSGYYFVTHDFFDVGGPNQSFMQASFAVVERTQMLNGQPAQFVRFTDTDFNSSNSYGAQPAHLESKELVPAGMCNPFVLGRPDLSGYQLVDLCVDWTNTSNSFLSDPVIIDAGESWNPGPSSVNQPGTGSTLGTLASFGRVMYRSSFRAYPDSKGLSDSMVFTLPVDLGGGHAGVRWAQIDFPEYPMFADVIYKHGFDNNTNLFNEIPMVANQGEFGPDSTDRWMPGISIDQDGNIGMAYSAANSSEGTFAGVRFTSRAQTDPANTLRDEQVCADGGGAQTSSSGRWGDYSSVSVDPVDECTFWASIEYQLTTADRNWSNRVCSFKMYECGDPTFYLTSDDTEQKVCTASGPAVINGNLFVNATSGFSNDVTLAFNPALPTGITGGFTPSIVTPNNSSALDLTIADTVAAGQHLVTVEGIALDSDNRTLDFTIDVVDSLPAIANLTAPADNATDISGGSVNYTWDAVVGAESYLIEIATDAGFTDIIESATVSTNSFDSTVGLAATSVAYWRVTANNYCGTGTTSAVFSFTTSNEICFTTVTGIPDNTPAGIDLTLNVVDSGTLTNLRVSAMSDHTWPGDLIFTLTHEGTTVVLMDRPGRDGSGFGCSQDGVDVLFDDASGTPVEGICEATSPGVTGTASPQEPLSAFIGAELSGDWVLNASDHVGADTGDITRFCLLPTL